VVRPPFQGSITGDLFTQGVALGWYVVGPSALKT
jgi:hypothetical protein